MALRAARVTALLLALIVLLVSPAEAAQRPASPAPAGPPPVVGAGAPPPPPGLTAQAWLVADLDTGAVLAAKDAHSPRAPASTLKVLTALALLPRIPPDRLLTPTFADVAVDGSKVGVLEGVAYTGAELFRSMLMVSGNDAANTLASGVGGTQAATVLMNQAAEQLGAVDTHAVNANGLDAPGQVSSAYDLALIARAAMQRPDFRAYVATVSATMPGLDGATFAIRNHNKLLTRYPGAIGVKNGYTVAARASFIGAAQRDGHTLLVTLMTADPKVQDEAVALMDWGFAAEKAGTQPVGRLPDRHGPEHTSAAVSSGGTREALRAQPSSSGAAAGPGASIGLAAAVVGLCGLVLLRLRARTRQRRRRRS